MTTYTAHLSKDGAVYMKGATPCTREEFEAALKSMAKAPGPVCEWTFKGGKLFSAQCGGGWWRIEDFQKCPSCERPIKRKSRAAR